MNEQNEQNQQNQQQAQQAPTAMGTAVEFSMAWLATQGDIGKMVQRTLVTALQESQDLRELLQGQTQEVSKLTADLGGLRDLAHDAEWLRSQLSTIPAPPAVLSK